MAYGALCFESLTCWALFDGAFEVNFLRLLQVVGELCLNALTCSGIYGSVCLGVCFLWVGTFDVSGVYF